MFGRVTCVLFHALRPFALPSVPSTIQHPSHVCERCAGITIAWLSSHRSNYAGAGAFPAFLLFFVKFIGDSEYLPMRLRFSASPEATSVTAVAKAFRSCSTAHTHGLDVGWWR